MRTSKVTGFNIQSWLRMLATLWVLFAMSSCTAWPQDSPSNPKMLARYLESLPSAKSSVSYVDSKILVSGASLGPSVQGKIDTLQTARIPRFFLGGFRANDIVPDPSIPTEQEDAGCANSSAWGQTATLLPDGGLLLVGGLGQTGPVTAAFIETPGSSQPTPLENVLNFPRAWHTSTLLPDGNVLVFGGVDSAGRVVTTPELFDLSAATFNLLKTPGPAPRAYHSATLLTDGTILIAGGLSSDGVLLSNAELWDPRTGARTILSAELNVARRNHCAILLSTGKVLLWGGTDASGERLNNGDLYDPETQSFSLVDTASAEVQASGEGPLLVASRPENGAQNVPLRGLIALRFSEHLSVGTVSSNTVSLNGPHGRTSIKVVPAERGILAFVTPDQPLLPDTSYSLLLDGLADAANRPLPTTQIVFTTVSAPTEANSDSGISDGGSASSGAQDSSSRDLPPLQAPSGVTAIAGQVLQLSGRPLANVTIRLDGTTQQTETDSTGRFLLVLGGNAIGGHRQIVIDGKTAGGGTRNTYGLFEYGMNVLPGITNLLPFIIWMPALDTVHAVNIPVPTRKETIVTTPLLPGLELRIPAGTVIRDYYGQTVHQITITQIPVNQPPFPLPNVAVPIYFTIQPGGAWLTQVSASGPQGAQLYYPNTYHKPVGTVFQFWNYNPDGQGWYIYGLGRVAPGGLEVVPDPGVLIYGFSGAMVGDSGAPPNGPPPGNNDNHGGEPVDLSTGLFTYTHTDLALPDVIPLTLTRTYRPNDPTSRAFGVGTSHPYDIFLITPNGDTDIYLILQDGGRIHFVKSGSIWVCNSSPTSFSGATLTYNNGWFIKKNDGTVLTFPISNSASTPQQEAMIGYKDRYGNALTFTRDSNSNLTQITSPNGRYIQFTLDSGGRITQATDSAGRVVSYVYDSGGRLSTVTDAKGGVTTYTYDRSSSNMVTVRDPRGIVYLTNQYDSNNRVIRQTLADNSTYQFAYIVDGQNNVTQATLTDQRGYIRQTTFNSSGFTLTNTLAVGTPQQQATTYNRDSSTNLVLGVTDALSRTTAYTYDSLGNTLSITRLSGTPDAVTTSYTYDPTFSQVTSITDPLGHVTNLTYDSVGNPITLADPLNHQWAFTYNTRGQRLSTTDPLSNTTRFAYFGGDLVSVTDSLARTMALNRDGAGRLIGLQDPVGAVTLYQYDPLDSLINTSDPLGNITGFTHDGDRDLVALTDALNNTTNYTYDNLDRLATRRDPLGHAENYTYDPAGNVFTFADRKGQQRTFTYDPLNRRINLTFADGSSISYTYDAGNRLTGTTDSSSGTITRNYDGLDRLTSEVGPTGSLSYNYDKASRRTSMTVAGQPPVSYSYDNANRLTQITQGTSTVSFTYDNANRRTLLTLANSVTATYSYDAASELTGLTYKLGTTVLGNLTYSYDADGRRTSVGGSYARTGLPQAVASASYNADNQLTQWGSSNLTYDLNGNLTNDGANTYSWNARNQLASINAGATASFQYDAFGRRQAKTIGGASTSFVYDRVNPVQELVSGMPTANLVTGLRVDEIFSRTDSAGTRQFLTDSLGSTLALTDSTGATQAQYIYEPFGNTSAMGSSANPYQYTGRENDGTGLYFYRARYYNPVFQRFVSEDPIGFRGGMNLYAYVGNNPLAFMDPSGMCPGCTPTPPCLMCLPPTPTPTPPPLPPWDPVWPLLHPDPCQTPDGCWTLPPPTPTPTPTPVPHPLPEVPPWLPEWADTAKPFIDWLVDNWEYFKVFLAL